MAIRIIVQKVYSIEGNYGWIYLR